jgi:cell division initiation protein
VAEQTFSPSNKRTTGYDMQEVDNFLDTMTQDYSALFAENADLRNKLKILAERINEYRETEDAIRATLYNAQKTANDMVAEAEQKREGILDALEEDIRARKASYDQEIAACQAQLAQARQQTADYLNAVQALTSQHQSFLDNLPDVGQGGELTEAPDEDDAAVQAAEEAAAEAVADVTGAEVPDEEPVEEEAPEEAAEDTADEEDEVIEDQPASDEVSAATTRIDFSNLKFGKDYEIK